MPPHIVNETIIREAAGVSVPSPKKGRVRPVLAGISVLIFVILLAGSIWYFSGRGNSSQSIFVDAKGYSTDAGCTQSQEAVNRYADGLFDRLKLNQSVHINAGSRLVWKSTTYATCIGVIVFKIDRLVANFDPRSQGGFASPGTSTSTLAFLYDPSQQAAILPDSEQGISLRNEFTGSETSGQARDSKTCAAIYLQNVNATIPGFISRTESIVQKKIPDVQVSDDVYFSKILDHCIGFVLISSAQIRSDNYYIFDAVNGEDLTDHPRYFDILGEYMSPDATDTPQ